MSVLLGVSFSVTLFSNWLLYEAAYKQETLRLVELVKTQAILIDAVASFDQKFSQNTGFNGAVGATLSQIEDAHQKYPGFGDTGEFTLGKRKNEEIIFLLSHRHFDFSNVVPIPWESNLGEPMRRALRGESGTVVGFDYRGEIVLAAHEPLPKLNAGIVAKIDISEIRAPFMRAGLFGLFGLLVMTSIGALVFRRISLPLVEREKVIADLHLLSHTVEQSPNLLFITDTEGNIEYANTKFYDTTGFSPKEVIGQTPRLLQSGNTPLNVYVDLWQTIKAGKVWHGEIEDHCKNGQVFWADVTITPIRSDDGTIRAYPVDADTHYI